MNVRRSVAWLLLAAGLLAYGAAGTVHVRRQAEIARAAEALQDLYRFLFERSIAHGAPFPATLAELPEWQRHVDGLDDPAGQAIRRTIVYACEPGAPEGTRLAAIELARMRVVLLQGGAVFAEPIRSRAERLLAPRSSAAP